ncbi:general transcription factor 3C polypeptide 2 [Arapaima gigas]
MSWTPALRAAAWKPGGRERTRLGSRFTRAVSGLLMASADQSEDGQGGDGAVVSPEQCGGPPVDLSSSRPDKHLEDTEVDSDKPDQSRKTGMTSQELSPGNGLGSGAGAVNGTEVDSARENHALPPSCEQADSTQLLSKSSGLSSGPPDNCLQKRRGRPPKNRTSLQKVPVTTKAIASCPSTSSENSHGKTPKPQKKRGRKSKAELQAMAEHLQASTSTQNTLQGPDDVNSGGRPKRRAATVARKYLQSLVEELDGSSEARDKLTQDRTSNTPTQQPSQARKRKQTGLDPESDDPNADADFVPESRDDAESEEDHSEDCSLYDSEEELRVPTSRSAPHSTKLKYQGCAANGLHNSIMGPIWCCANITKAFREENLSSWVFPEWIPSAKDWHFLSASEAEKYLPQEAMSPAFRVSREGLKEETTLFRVPRFGSLAAHPERWDMVFFVGGPVWSMEWCPCPDGTTDHQYAAIYCHQGMDNRHKAMETYSEPTLLQVWDMGELLYDTSPSKQPTLAYAIAMDDGCIWDMKWCPSGSWELPSTSRKAPLMPRLGLLAAAFSSAKIAIYSLPHPNALRALRRSKGKELDHDLLICQVQKVADLKLGSIQANHDEQSGQCFCMDWLPVKPHNILAAGFNDGTLALWNLSTKSLLQRVRSSSSQVTVYPYHCFNAHDSGVRVLSWCKASSHLIVTASNDRKVKMWDLRKTHEPSNSFRRFLSTEISWPLLWSGLCVAQESCYATYGQHGIHYLDSGYLGFKPFFMAPRKATIWSISFSDWLNTAIVGDSIGDMIVMVFPEMTCNPANLKRTTDRRFPVFTTEMVPFESFLEREDGDEGGEDMKEAHNKAQTYSEVTKKFYLHFHDIDLRTFKNAFQRPLVKQMLQSEIKGIISLDKMPLESLHKVRFNPNLSSLSWMLSAGHTGLVRAHCLRAMHSPVIHKMAEESQVQFAAMFLPQGDTAGECNATAVRQSTESTVEIV